MKVIINQPIWKKPESVGIKKSIIIEDIEVEISYKDKNGNKIFPHIYQMTKVKALIYPTKIFGNTPELVIIPIQDFDIKVPVRLTEEEQAKEDYYKSQGIIK
jgi:hypothetical protein